MFLDYGDDVFAAVEAAATADLAQALTIADKQEREAAQDAIKDKAERLAGRSSRVARSEISAAYRSLTKKLVRQRVLRDEVRIDGRGLTDIRPLPAEVGVVPRVHGSALFQRGETQILGITTLNMLRSSSSSTRSPPETTQALHAQLQLPAVLHRRDRPRRLAEATRDRPRRARRARPRAGAADRGGVPYAIRQVSEALGSNGSTSMGSVCASTLGLLNAGVPLRAPVAGIAMGLISGRSTARRVRRR